MENVIRYGVRANINQVAQQLLQVLLVGMTLGMTRTVVPALAESEFGVASGSFLLLSTFVIAFGFVKGALNFVAGRMAEHFGRKRVLLIGWLIALPIPLLLFHASSWSWIVVATFLLGINQGLTWSMTQTIKLDLTSADQRGLVIGLNEFSGYVGVAAAGVITAYLAATVGTHAGLLWFGLTVIALALLFCALAVEETLPWANNGIDSAREGHPTAIPTTSEVFALMSWRDARFVAVNQAGLVEKFVDALVWIFYPVYLYQRGVDLPAIGWIVGIYGFTWGGSQLVTGRLSDHIGRQYLNVWGMWICGGGVALMLFNEGIAWWSFAAAVSGIGMAMLYPNLSAAIADLAPASWRASAIGIYRFWRDTGYGIGALALGAIASVFDSVTAAFWFTAISMFVSGLWLLLYGRESHRPIR